MRANLYIDGLVQDCSISIANAPGKPQSCTQSSISYTKEPCFVHFSISGQTLTELFSGIEIICMQFSSFYTGFNLASRVTHIPSSTLLMVSNQNNNKVYEYNDIETREVGAYNSAVPIWYGWFSPKSLNKHPISRVRSLIYVSLLSL